MSFKRLYLLIATLAGLIGAAIALGTLFFTLINSAFISDEEYILSHSWKLNNCEYNEYAIPVGEDEAVIEKTPEEIAACEADARQEIIQERHINRKEAIIGSVSWGMIALVLLLVHGVPFYRVREER